MRLKFYAAATKREEEPSAKDLVTILPNEPTGATHVHATIDDSADEHDFRPVSEVNNEEMLRADYEKLRVAYELSKSGVSLNLKDLLERTLDVAFSVLPADNGLILLIDGETGVLSPHTVKHKDSGASPKEIVLSHTIINQVLNDRTSVLLSDAFLDPRFSGAQSIISQGIRSAMCVSAGREQHRVWRDAPGLAAAHRCVRRKGSSASQVARQSGRGRDLEHAADAPGRRGRSNPRSAVALFA